MKNKITALLALGALFAGCTHNKPASIVDMPAPGSMNDFISCVGDRVHFDYDVYKLNEEAKNCLCKQAEWLKKYDYNIEIIGHCDERGTTEYNYALGEKRASAARKHLEEQGVSSSRIATSSVGKDSPICEGSNEEAWAKNRCAVILLKKGSSYVAQSAGTKELVKEIEPQPQD